MRFISRRGQVDQIVTSIIIVFFALFLSGVFVVISSNIAEITAHEPPEAREATVSASGSSQALLDIFLSDEIVIGTNSLSVQQAFSEFFRLNLFFC